MSQTQAMQRSQPQHTDLSLVKPPETNSLAKLNMRELKDLAGIMLESGAFPDIKTAAQAMVKVIAGNELGFSPIVSMTGIHFFQGKVSLGANLIASLIKDSGKYEYKITEHTTDACSVVFYQMINNELKQLGVPVRYTISDAQKAGLTGKDIWKKYPMDMLFAACIRQGARRYCADILRGVTAETDTESPQEIDRSAMADDPRVNTPPNETADADAIDAEIVEDATPAETPATSTAAPTPHDVDPDEGKAADLMIAIVDLFTSKLGGDADEIAKVLKGQDLSQMSLTGLQKLHGDLLAM